MENEKRVISINEFCRRYGIGRTSVYAEIKAARLLVVKVGKRTLITTDAAEAWLKNLPIHGQVTSGLPSLTLSSCSSSASRNRRA